MESSDYGHLIRGVDNLQISVCIKEGWLCVHDPVSHDGCVVVMRLHPHQVDAVRGSVD